MKHTALLIPADITEPLEFVEFDDTDLDSWGELIGVGRHEVDINYYPEHAVQALVDDIAYLRDEVPEVNLRMNLLDGKLVNDGGIRLSNMISGDVVLIGVNSEASAADLQEAMIDLARETHKEAVVLARKVAEAEVRLKSTGIID